MLARQDHVAAQAQIVRVPPDSAVIAQAGGRSAECRERELQSADVVGTKAADLGIDLELPSRSLEIAMQGERAIAALSDYLDVDRIELPSGFLSSRSTALPSTTVT